VSDSPEHDKLAAVRERSQAIGEFLDFSGYKLCEYVAEAEVCGECDETVPGYVPVRKSIPDILAAYFNIDQDALEVEKRAALEALSKRTS
jgi:hypothetical protein